MQKKQVFVFEIYALLHVFKSILETFFHTEIGFSKTDLMASIAYRDNGNRRILYLMLGKKRKQTNCYKLFRVNRSSSLE